MNIGMLWFDNDPKAGLSIKIERAASYYRTKYGKIPTLCFVHPSMLPTSAPSELQNSPDGKAYTPEGVEIRSNRSVLPNHFWIGVNTPSDTRA
jgi:hypothetical protein